MAAVGGQCSARGAQVQRAGARPFDLIVLEADLGSPEDFNGMLAEGGRIVVLSSGRLTWIQGDQRKNILMVH